MRSPAPPLRLLGLLGAHRRLAAAALAAALLAAAAALAVPGLVRAALDGGSGRSPADGARLLFVPAAAWLAAAALQLVRNVLAQRLGRRVVTDLRQRVVAHALRLPVAYFDAARTGDLMARLGADAEQLHRALVEGGVRAAGELATVLGGAVLLWAMDWRLTAGLAAFALAAPLIHRRLSPMLRALHRDTLEATAAAMSRVGEALGGLRVVKSFGREAHEAAVAARRLERAHDAATRAAGFESLVWSGAAVAFGLAGFGVIGYGLQGIAAGRLSPGTLLAYFYTLTIVGLPLVSLAGIAGRAERARAAADRLYEILDQPAETDDAPGAPELEVTGGSIDFEGVDFAYATGPPVLDGFSLHLPAGRTTALVGATGAGKSTVVALLQRFHEPAAGAIRIDGVPIAAVSRSSLRGACAVVPQQALLFDGSIGDNIRYGRLDAGDDDVRRAAAAAHVDEFADRLPDGLGSAVGERGVRLSGGQAQRIAIARALLRDAPILLLDEATSSLDPASESLVHDALRTLTAGRTTLVIAHRLATVERADRVALLDGGRIVALGTHAELCASSARYAQLFFPAAAKMPAP